MLAQFCSRKHSVMLSIFQQKRICVHFLRALKFLFISLLIFKTRNRQFPSRIEQKHQQIPEHMKRHGHPYTLAFYESLSENNT